MNKDHLHELRILVERVIRPLRGGANRKRKMREELLAHLTAVFEEEYATTDDETVALERARTRFGDPTALTRQLEASLPAGEWWEWAVHHQMERRPGEPLWRNTIRLLIWLNLLLAFLGLLCVLLSLGNSDLAGRGGGAFVVFALDLMPTLLWIGSAVSAVVLIGHAMSYALDRPARLSWPPFVLLAFAAGCGVPLSWIPMSIVETGLASAEHMVLQLLSSTLFTFAFMGYAGWKLRHGRVERSWRQTILVDTLAFLVAGVLVFAISLALQNDVKACLQIVYPVLFTALVLIPLDLIWSKRSVLERIRADQEWANLQID